MASKYGSLTPYNYSLNNPTNLNDPLGDDVEPQPPYPREYLCAQCWREGDNLKNYMRASGGGMYGGWSGGGFFGGNGPMGAYWHPGDGRLFWSGYESFARGLRHDADAVRYGAMSLEEYGSKNGRSISVDQLRYMAYAHNHGVNPVTGVRYTFITQPSSPRLHVNTLNVSFSKAFGPAFKIHDQISLNYWNSLLPEANRKASVVGVLLSMTFTPNASDKAKFSKFGWVYTINSNVYAGGYSGNPHNSPSYDGEPTCFTSSDQVDFRDNAIVDWPTTPYGERTVWFTGELSVVGYSNGAWHPIINLTFGWNFNDSGAGFKFEDFHPVVGPVSSWHLDSITNKKKW